MILEAPVLVVDALAPRAVQAGLVPVAPDVLEWMLSGQALI
jgi:hypothetical protein